MVIEKKLPKTVRMISTPFGLSTFRHGRLCGKVGNGDELTMVGKRVQFDDETWAVINLLRQERRRSFQQLADEAFADLLSKHGHPVELKNQLRESLGKTPVKRPRKTRTEN